MWDPTFLAGLSYTGPICTASCNFHSPNKRMGHTRYGDLHYLHSAALRHSSFKAHGATAGNKCPDQALAMRSTTHVQIVVCKHQLMLATCRWRHMPLAADRVPIEFGADNVLFKLNVESSLSKDISGTLTKQNNAAKAMKPTEGRQCLSWPQTVRMKSGHDRLHRWLQEMHQREYHPIRALSKKETTPL